METTELGQIMQSASQGYWIPFAIMTSAWSVIIGLLLYIYNRNQKENEKRHSEHTEILRKLTDNQHAIQILVTELKTKQDFMSIQKK
jgi:hypothetical protein